MNNEILDSLRRISCGMEIVMRDVIEEKYNMDRDYIEIEDWELELPSFSSWFFFFIVGLCCVWSCSMVM